VSSLPLTRGSVLRVTSSTGHGLSSFPPPPCSFLWASNVGTSEAPWKFKRMFFHPSQYSRVPRSFPLFPSFLAGFGVNDPLYCFDPFFMRGTGDAGPSSLNGLHDAAAPYEDKLTLSSFCLLDIFAPVVECSIRVTFSMGIFHFFIFLLRVFLPSHLLFLRQLPDSGFLRHPFLFLLYFFFFTRGCPSSRSMTRDTCKNPID